MRDIIFIALAVAGLACAGYFYVRDRRHRAEDETQEKEMRQRMYELAILKEISDRVGYSLSIEKIVDVITGSLNQFIEYSVASSMILTQDRIIYKAFLEAPVSKEFVKDVEQRMLGSLAALLGESLEHKKMEETITGAIMMEEHSEPLRSFFNIPLVIGERVAGVLTVAHTKEGMYKEAEMTLLYKVVHQAAQEINKLHEVVETEQNKLSAMVESMAEGVIMTDNEYRVLVVNPVARRALGLEHHDDISIFDIIESLGGKFDIRGRLEESLKLDRPMTANDVVIGERSYQVFVSPVKSGLAKQKDTLGGVVIFHDITHEKEVEKMREDFTSMMVHELRSPLDGIKKMGEMMRSDDSIRQDKKTFLEYIELMHEGSSDMLELVNELLDIAKLESGKFEIHPESASITKVIDERVAFFDTSARDAKIHIGTHYAQNVPAAIALDARRIAQVLTNLIANAVKFTDAGGTVTIQVFSHAKERSILDEAHDAGVTWFVKKIPVELAHIPNAVIVAVTDSGIGIAADKIGFLFNKFKQLETSAHNKDRGGTGLGLVIAKGIIEAHGGVLSAASEEGSGSTFYFALPV